MESNLEVRILLETDQDLLERFARDVLERTATDQMEIEMQSWVARWRPESLAYYLPQGWSFGTFRNGKLTGFILGQPLLFFRGLTQTLWIEELVYTDEASAKELLDVAYKWSRDKHLQCVLIEASIARNKLVEGWKHAHEHHQPMIELRSSRF